jgi:exo-beta-1,3-glucanase (GH17 family)
MLPYWEGIEVQSAVDHVMARMKDLQARFPDKQIVIGEVGWPSDGRTQRRGGQLGERGAVPAPVPRARSRQATSTT